MDQEIQELQDAYLTKLVEEQTILNIYLINGIKLVGIIVKFDRFVILLARDGKEQLIYKHAVSTIDIDKTLNRK